MNPDAWRVLVTGIGGFFAQGVVKALRLSPRPYVCYGCDSDPAGIGNAYVDAWFPVPPAQDADRYVAALDRLCRSQGIQAVIAGSDPERAVLSRQGAPPRLSCGTAIIGQPANSLWTYGDKLFCQNALHGKIDLVPFADGKDPDAVLAVHREAGFPVVVKSRRSSGGRSFHVAYAEPELAAILGRMEDPLVQAYIDDEGGEYSAAVFTCGARRCAIAFRRKLGPAGCSWEAETADDPEVRAYVQDVAAASGLQGSVNIQVRRGRHGVRLLEINPRFSSLVAARAAAGFRDVEWSVEMALGVEPRFPSGPFRQVRFHRCFHELVDLGDGFRSVAEWAPRAQTCRHESTASSSAGPPGDVASMPPRT